MPGDLPRDYAPDNTLALLVEGYEFIGNRQRRHHSDVFETRLLLQRTVCMTGADAARVFYDEQHFQRARAAPGRLARTLFGRGGVQQLDGTSHRHRKQMLLDVLTGDGAVDDLAAHSSDVWRAAVPRWRQLEEVVLLRAAQQVLCRAVCDWAGVPLHERELVSRTRDLVSMIEGAGAVGPAHWRARRARGRAERWAAGLIADVRSGVLLARPGSALATIAMHREPDGSLLDARTAAVELLNVLRPTVAVAYYIVFLALALQSFPETRARLMSGAYEPHWFVQEVRRYYPFFPFVAARTRHDFDWEGYRIPGGTRTLLDLYGTNHDPRLWKAPERFEPERFRDWDGDPFRLIPQGGNGYADGHRCPGEWITIELMERALRFLLTEVTYEVPPQDLRVSLAQMPAGPSSGFVIRRVTG